MDMNKGLFPQSKLIKILLVILIFLIILAIALFLSFTKIRESIHDSQVIPLIKNHLNERKSIQQEVLLSLYFPILSVKDSSYRYTKTSVMIKNDEYIAHRFIEQLLQEVPQGALIEGALSFIPPNTQLIGYTVSKNIGYIHLSHEFIQPTVFEETVQLRIDQLRKNIMENFSLRDIVVIVDDVILTI
jgi:spore germination protein GerM